MITGGESIPFWKAHWDWLALGAAVLLLAAAGVVAASALSVNEDEAASDTLAEAIAKPIANRTGIAPVDLKPYESAVALAQNPPLLGAVAAKGGNFLTAPGRVRCEFCNVVRRPGTNECFACHKAPTAEKSAEIVLDGDGDGLPDVWEKAHGLNPGDPSDAGLDKDSDGFTNAEEFAAKTDPEKKTSHPDYLASLALQLPLKETYMPFFFTGVYKTPSGLKYNFKNPSRVREYDRGVYSVLEGKEIGDTGFVAKSYEAKTAKQLMGGGMTKSVDASEATVVRVKDKRAIKLVINRKKTPIDIEATLVFSRALGGVKQYAVVAGSEISLRDEKYTVKSVEPVGKGAKVTLEDLVGKLHVIQALEQ